MKNNEQMKVLTDKELEGVSGGHSAIIATMVTFGVLTGLFGSAGK